MLLTLNVTNAEYTCECCSDHISNLLPPLDDHIANAWVPGPCVYTSNRAKNFKLSLSACEGHQNKF